MILSLRHGNPEHISHALVPGSLNKQEMQDKKNGTYPVVYEGFVRLGVCKF